MASRVKRTVEEKFVLFDNAADCARAAAPVFAEQRWRWTSLSGFPKEHNILDTLLMLEETAKEPGLTPHTETGRLVYHRGKFGYQRP
jgi:hypothetical protein